MNEHIHNSDAIAARRSWIQLSLGSVALLAGCAPRETRSSISSNTPESNYLSVESLSMETPYSRDVADLDPKLGLENYETSLGQSWVVSHVSWPSIWLANQESESIELYRDLIANRQVVINFFYTRCTGNCPVTMGRMIKLARSLSAEQRQNYKFISVSLDSTHERPEDLASYARAVLPEDIDWQLLCGPQATVDRLRRYLGFYELNEVTDAIPKSHASMVLFGNDQSHRWITLPAVSTFRQWRSVLARVSA